MSFAKFVFLLRKQVLTFVRPECFPDPFEGSYFPADVDAIVESILDHPDQADTIFHNAATVDWCNRSIAKQAHVCCWHMGEEESDAMWRLYGGTNDCIAIRSTVARLDGIRGKDAAFFVRAVIYPPMGQVTDASNVFNAILRKRPAFQHERELRAIYTTYAPYAAHKTDQNVLLYPIDPAQLIEGVALAPGSER